MLRSGWLLTLSEPTSNALTLPVKNLWTHKTDKNINERYTCV